MSPEDAATLKFPVVGIGVSSSGRQAYLELLRGLPANLGMAFVVVPHGYVDQEDRVIDLLSTYTPMPVAVISDGLHCEPDHVYVVPSNTCDRIQGGQFALDLYPADTRARGLIDRFFLSLATDQKNRAIGILLSGTETDGALGLKAIKSKGGIAMVQSPESARFVYMPHSGIQADQADLVIAPARMGAELGKLATQSTKSELGLLESGQAPDDETHFLGILSMLRGISGVELRSYKPPVTRRRLARRMLLQHVDSLAEYRKRLQASPNELRNLQEDLLSNSTGFFRDSQLFEILKRDIFPKLFAGRDPDQQIRIWSAGCSTGEETYSLAIALLEYLRTQSVEPSIQIFGTDINESAVENARNGIYSEVATFDISPERLQRYFQKSHEGYQVSKWIRDLCVFARQNLCVDPPFARLDLICCREVLSYLLPEVQSRLLTTFHYALRHNGCLVLGSSETLVTGDRFRLLDKNHNIYSRADAPSSADTGSLLPGPRAAPRELTSFSTWPADNWSEQELQRAADRVVLTRHAPPGVVVDERLNVLQVRGQLAPYLQMPTGTPSLNLLRMTSETLFPALRGAVDQAMTRGAPAQVKNVIIHEAAQSRVVTVEVVPFERAASRPRCYLVSFLEEASLSKPEVDHGVAAKTDPSGTNDSRETLQLRQDLESTRLHLQALIEEREARNQELTSAYEEVQSANEELQSTNEELETAKEELQSANEELQTVNDEMRDRNTALLQASNDLANLFNGANIPIVMLGMDLTIRHFTPPAERLMNLRQSDVGRPIMEIRLNLRLEALEPLLHEVLDTLGTQELEVQDRQNRWHLLRIRPYRTADNKIDGLVLLLVDVDHIRRSEETMRAARDLSQAALECIEVPLVVLNDDLRVHIVNNAFCKLTQLDPEELKDRSFPDLASLLWNLDGARQLLHKIKNEAPSHQVFEHQDKDGCVFRLSVQTLETETPMLLVLMTDITKEKEAEQQAERERNRLAEEVQGTVEALSRTRQKLSALAAGLFASQEEERRRVARELHDDISQKLALLEIQASEFQKTLPDELGLIKDQMRGWAIRVGELSEDVRLLSHRLHPSILDDLGLAPALRQIVREFGEREQMPASFEAFGTTDDLSHDAITALYRITQEALRNVAKHAGKTHVRVTLMSVENGVRLTVKDLGHGFDMGESAGGLGPLSMEERARLVGGAFRIESEVNAGTTVEVEVPALTE